MGRADNAGVVGVGGWGGEVFECVCVGGGVDLGIRLT